MKKIVKVQDRAIGAGHPTFLIAEIGTNHNGDLTLALDMVKAAAAAGESFERRCCFTSENDGSFPSRGLVTASRLTYC